MDAADLPAEADWTGRLAGDHAADVGDPFLGPDEPDDPTEDEDEDAEDLDEVDDPGLEEP
jgi:hypothetical protein